MLRFLFPRLTADPDRGETAFKAASVIARRQDWYRHGKVADTLDGRFAVLVAVLALVLNRLEQLDERGNAVAVALTERFIAVMEAEHRELGLGDPSLGKTVRRLVGSLARRTALVRDTVGGQRSWIDTVGDSFGKAAPKAEWVANQLQLLWQGLATKSAEQIERGDLT